MGNISNTIASRCLKAGDRFHAGDNISKHIKEDNEFINKFA